MDINSQQGFTLIELLVAMAIAGILLGIGVPSFTEAVREARISSQYNTLVGSLFLARSEAVKGPGLVTVCPRESEDSNQCGATTDWQNGWLVFIDNTTVQGETTANVDADDEIIAVESALDTDNTITAIGSSTNSVAGATDIAFIRYTQSGGAEWRSSSIIICDANRGAESSRSINIVLTGDIRRGRPSGSSQIPRDVFDREICADEGTGA